MRGFIKRFIITITNFICLYVRSIIVRKRKNILLVPQAINIGGTKTYFNNIIDYLISRNYNITIFYKDGELNEIKRAFLTANQIKWYKYTNQFDLKEHRYPLKHSLFKYFIIDFIKQANIVLKVIVKQRIGRVIISANFPTMFFPAMFSPIKTIYVLHSMPWGVIDNGNYFMINKIVGKRKRIVTVSEFSKRIILKEWRLEPKAHNIEVIYNFYEKKAVQHYKRRSDKITILTIGTVALGKQPEVWLQVAQKLTQKYTNVFFIWLGNGPLYEKYRHKTENLPRINFKGHKNNIDDYYMAANIYFQPSKRESHGIAIVGAMACELPVVTTNNGGMIESVLNEYNGYTIEPNNINEMIEKLEILINNASLRKQMGEKARKRYSNMFTKKIWEEQMDKLMK